MGTVFPSRTSVNGFCQPQIFSLEETLSPCIVRPNLSHIAENLSCFTREPLKEVNNFPSFTRYLPDKTAGASEMLGWKKMGMRPKITRNVYISN